MYIEISDNLHTDTRQWMTTWVVANVCRVTSITFTCHIIYIYMKTSDTLHTDTRQKATT